MHRPTSRSVWSTVNILLLPAALGWLAATPLPAQEPPGKEPPGREPPPGRQGADRERPRRARPAGRRRARQVTALKVGQVHPVAGPTIENGVILFGGGRILGVGPADRVRIPSNAQVVEFPDAHAYPGLVDAMSTAFAPSRERSNASVNAGTDFFAALDVTDEESRKLVEYGITTAYVSNRSTATWRGLGAIVRPTPTGFTLLRNHRHGGVGLRMTTGNRAGHALDRLTQFDRTGNVFDTLDAYEEKRAEYAAALEKYEKDYAAYLAHFAKSSKGKKAAKPPAKGKPEAGKQGDPAAQKRGAQPATRDPQGTPPNRGRRRGGNGSGERGGRRRGAARRPGRSGATPATPNRSKQPAKGKSGSQGGNAPKKPKYPKLVKEDEAKEALLKVADGKLPLRIEAHRVDEIRAALMLAFVKDVPGIVLENATAAAEIAGEIAEAGAPVVVTDLLPGEADYAKTRDGALPAKLHAAGVPVAIGSGSVENARNLTLMAAYAAGRGLPKDAAIRALTLDAAKILGIDDQVGSLARNKVADIVVTSGPLLGSDTEVLRVIAGGRTQYERGEN